MRKATMNGSGWLRMTGRKRRCRKRTCTASCTPPARRDAQRRHAPSSRHDRTEHDLHRRPETAAQRPGLAVGPMFHAAELHCVFLPRVHIGASSVIMHHFDTKQILQLVQDEKVDHFFAAPTMWNMLLQEDLSQYDLSALKKGLYGAAPMAPTLVKALKDSWASTSSRPTA